ncbi:MAG: O-antigen ligase family protein [Acidaminococcaceae bacterium]|nr:O-antigen ligase family protein [Acidaminococcaceae bacterium]
MKELLAWWQETTKIEKIIQMLVFLLVFGYAGRGSGAYVSIPTGLAVAFILYDCVRKKSLAGFRMPMVYWLPLCLFTGSVWLSSLLMGDAESIHLANQYIYWSLPFFLMAYLARQTDVKYAALSGVIVALLCVSLYTVYLNYQMLHTGLAIRNRLSPWLHVNTHALMLLGSLPVLFCAFMDKKVIRNKQYLVLLCITLILGLWALWKTGSRGAMIGLCSGGFIVFLIKYYGRAIWKILLVLIISCTVVISGYAFWGIVPGGTHGYDDKTRVRATMASYEMWKDHKWCGVGLANWQQQYRKKYIQRNSIKKAAKMFYIEKMKKTGKKVTRKGIKNAVQRALKIERRYPHPHNAAAYIISTTGCIGGIGYLCFLIGYLNLFVLKAIKFPQEWMLFAGGWIFIAMSLHGLVDLGITYKGAARLLYMMIALSLSCCFAKRTICTERDGND